MGKDSDPDVDFYGKGVHADVEAEKAVNNGSRSGCAVAFLFIATVPLLMAYFFQS